MINGVVVLSLKLFEVMTSRTQYGWLASRYGNYLLHFIIVEKLHITKSSFHNKIKNNSKNN